MAYDIELQLFYISKTIHYNLKRFSIFSCFSQSVYVKYTFITVPFEVFCQFTVRIIVHDLQDCINKAPSQ